MRLNHQATGDVVGDLGTVILAHDMKTQVDGRCTPRGRQDLALVDVEHPGIDFYAGVHALQRVGILPVCRGTFAVEQPRGGQHECTGAYGDDPGAFRMCLAQGREQVLGHFHRRIFLPAGHDDGVGIPDVVQTPGRHDFQAQRGRHSLAGVQPCGLKYVRCLG